MKRYPNYKDSGVPWLGQVPAHWPIMRYKYLFLEKQAKKESTLQAGAISYGRVVYKDDEMIPPATKASYQEVLKGEYLINPINLNYDLKSLRTALSEINVCVSPAYIVLRPTIDSEPRYLKHQLHLFDVCHMKTLGAGVRQTISFGDIGVCRTILPPKEEQAAIALFLDRVVGEIDSAIASQERMVELLKERRSAIITQAVTKGLDPKAKMKHSGVPWLGSVNQSWKYLPLKQVVRRPIQNGLGESSSRSDENDPRYIRITDIGADGRLRDDTFSSVPLEECKDAFVLRGDVLCAAVGGTVGKSYLHLLEGDYCYAGYLVRIRPESRKVTSKFLKYWAESKNYWSQIEANLVKVTIENFSASRYSRMYIPLPGVDEQNVITDYLDGVIAELDAAISSQVRMIELLKERRSAIITQAVTGQIDVR